MTKCSKIQVTFFVYYGGSSNGRTADSGSAYRSSNLCPPAKE